MRYRRRTDDDGRTYDRRQPYHKLDRYLSTVGQLKCSFRRGKQFLTDTSNLRQNFDKQLQILTEEITGVQNFHICILIYPN